mmetsp:Transcript_183/g.360  ORF Transcript_183/g.360 Transcript_183/m.360 type:complete len:642 (+) Transcript_183:1476-3401(+)
MSGSSSDTRANNNNNNSNDDNTTAAAAAATAAAAVEASRCMKARIPEFVGVFCSPYHLRDRGQELWNTIRVDLVRNNQRALTDMVQEMILEGQEKRKKKQNYNDSTDSSDEEEDDIGGDELEQLPELSQAVPSLRKFLQKGKYNNNNNNNNNNHNNNNDPMMRRSQSQGKGMTRKISVCPSHDGTVKLEVYLRSVMFYIPYYNAATGIIEASHGYQVLQQLAKELAAEQKLQAWKVTLMQKTIGGPHPVNGADVLTAGQLCADYNNGILLHKVMEEFTTIIHHLQSLTRPHEKNVIQQVRSEYEALSARCHRRSNSNNNNNNNNKNQHVQHVSKLADEFCGSCIKKNFLPGTGRFDRLREFGQKFRGNEFMLEPAEQLPATCLGTVLQRGVELQIIFDDAMATESALDQLECAWLDVLEQATSFVPNMIGVPPNATATDRIWTCGLTDAGLHNTFLSEERGLELFDLGKPQLMPVPAFLTKFLMSFFHAIGMEEVEEEQQTGLNHVNNTNYTTGTNTTPPSYTWVRRFETVPGQGDQKLVATKATQDLLPGVYDAFGKVLDHFIAHVFDNDERVRSLLIKYVVLQLLSDSAFCLLRWEEKGGGAQRYGKQAKGLHKWLWRSLWDFYIASEVYEKLLVSHQT